MRDATLHADVTARSLSRIDVSGASQVHLSDVLTGTRFEVVVSGAGRLDGTARVDLANVKLSGASTADVSVTDTISAGVSGASSLTYRGSPEFTRRDVSGGSSITTA